MLKGGDDTLYAAKDGIIKFSTKLKIDFTGTKTSESGECNIKIKDNIRPSIEGRIFKLFC